MDEEMGWPHAEALPFSSLSLSLHLVRGKISDLFFFKIETEI